MNYIKSMWKKNENINNRINNKDIIYIHLRSHTKFKNEKEYFDFEKKDKYFEYQNDEKNNTINIIQNIFIISKYHLSYH